MDQVNSVTMMQPKWLDAKWLDALRGVRRVICHRNSAASQCPDGVASAVIIHDVLPKATIVFASHGAELDAMDPQEGTMFVDICPRTRVDEHRALGTIVLDHHKSHEAEVRSFGDRGVYGNEQESGALLAWSRVWRPLATRPASEQKSATAFALLACVRDTWQRSHPWWNAACEVSEALAFFSWDDYWSRILRPFLGDEDDGNASAFDRLLQIGKPLRAARLLRAKDAADGAMIFTTEKGTRVAMVNVLDTSDVAELISGVDVLAGFSCRHDGSGDVIRFSLRARGDYDVGDLAKLFGGGGHRAAAGFVLPASSAHPLDHFRSLLNAQERVASRR